MKNLTNLLLVALMALGILFGVSCKKDPKEEKGFVIEAKNVADGSSEIATVKGRVYIGEDEKTIASAKYNNGGFKLTLPYSVDGITKDLTRLWIDGFDNSANDIGFFSCSAFKMNEYYYSLNYNYVIRDMHYTYEYEYVSDYDGFLVKSTYDCNYTKGWNIDYTQQVSDEVNKIRTFTTTTNKPAGVNFTWNFLYMSPSLQKEERNFLECKALIDS